MNKLSSVSIEKKIQIILLNACCVRITKYILPSHVCNVCIQGALTVAEELGSFVAEVLNAQNIKKVIFKGENIGTTSSVMLLQLKIIYVADLLCFYYDVIGGRGFWIKSTLASMGRHTFRFDFDW